MATESRTLAAMKTMAWERAKGELRSMLHTMYPDYDHPDDRFKRLDKEINKFIENIEDNGLQE